MNQDTASRPPDQKRDGNAGPRQGPGVLLDGPEVITSQVLAVGSERYLHQLQRALLDAKLVAKVSTASDYLMGLGQAARVTPNVVIGQVDRLGPMRDATIAALRRLLPKARLIVTAEPDQEDQAIEAVEAGFDQYLLEPLDPAMLASAIKNGSAEHQPELQSSSPAARASHASAPAAAAKPAGETIDPEDPWLAVTPAVIPDPNQSSETRKAQQGDAMSASHRLPEAMDNYETDDAELGDIDLIDCLLSRPAEFQAMVLKLVAARSGIAGVALATGATDVPSGHAGVWVSYRGRRLGVLHAPPPVVKAQLSPWASWLAHWLALERKTVALWEMANKDELSGAWNRRYFDRYLARVLSQAAQKRFPVTLLVFDIDNFKTYNDRYGHAAGDEILRETVRLMRSVIREHDVVARIGGDEFAVIFWDPHGPRRPNSSHPDDVREAARRFQKAICGHAFPKLLEEAPGTLSISGGLASFPWDGATPQALVERADAMLLHSKAQGKNAITFGAGAARAGDPFEG